MSKTVGIPRTLAYFTFFPMWKAFFEELGIEVVLSRQTDKRILEMGIKDSVTDACLPIKLFHGHVAALKDRVDYLFIPRLVSADGRSTFCPKFLGLPEMVRFSVPDLPPLIDVRYNIRKGRVFSSFTFFKQVGEHLGYNFQQISKGYLKARRALRNYQDLQCAGMMPEEAMKALTSSRLSPSAPAETDNETDDHEALRIAVLGYPYAVFDPFVNADLLNILRTAGTKVLTVEMVSDRNIRKMSRELKEDLYWYYSNRAVWAGLHYLSDGEPLDGIIHVTAFACGPDAMVDKLLELESRDRGRVPYLNITIDEHAGDVGVVTRIEAFLDMLKIRKGLT